MPYFFQTMMGRKFFEATMPGLVKEVGRLADAIENNDIDEDVAKILLDSLGSKRDDLETVLRGAQDAIRSSGSEFHRSRYGQTLTEGLLPQFNKKLKRISVALESKAG